MENDKLAKITFISGNTISYKPTDKGYKAASDYLAERSAKAMPVMSSDTAHTLMEGLLALTELHKLDRKLSKKEWERKAEQIRLAGKYVVESIKVQT
jgi:predicted phage-related endonuclease